MITSAEQAALQWVEALRRESRHDARVRVVVHRWETAVTTYFEQAVNTEPAEEQCIVATEYWHLLNGGKVRKTSYRLTSGQFRSALSVSLSRGLEPVMGTEPGDS